MQEHALIIPRVSTLKQREEDQTPELLKYAERKGYAVNPDAVVPIHGKSAFHGKHAKAILKAVDEHVRHGQATVVIFRHVDRMSRLQWEDGMRFFLKIRDAGARVEFSEQEFLNGNMELLGMFLKLANEESKVKQSRKLQGNTRKRNAGELVGRVPWGYDPVLEQRGEFKVQVGLKPNTLGREWIPKIFAEIINGKSLRGISDMLRGIPSPQKHNKWNEATVRRLVANATYYGAMEGNPNLKFEALISVEVYKSANLAIESRGKRGRSAVKHEPALVRPYCGACWEVKRDGCPSGKSPMYIARSSRWAYYSCRGIGPARKSCGAKVIPVAILDAAVEDIMAHDDRPHMIPEYAAGDDNNEKRAVINEKIKTAVEAGDYALVAKLSQEAESIWPSGRKASITLVPSGQTVGQHWEGLSLEEKREELLRWTVVAYPDMKVRIFGDWGGVIKRYPAEA